MFVSRSANSVAVVGSCCNFFFVALCRTLHKKREIEKVCLTCLPIINPFFYGYRLSFVYFCLYRVGTTLSLSPSLILSTYAHSMKTGLLRSEYIRLETRLVRFRIWKFPSFQRGVAGEARRGVVLIVVPLPRPSQTEAVRLTPLRLPSPLTQCVRRKGI